VCASVPMRAFDGSAVIVTDDRGAVTQSNDAATCLARSGDQGSHGWPCWKLFGFRTTDGDTFCSSACPVQRLARLGRLPARHRVTPGGGGRWSERLDLLSFAIPQRHEPGSDSTGGRRPILHLVLPVPPADGATERDRLHALTPREAEVLQLLARGLGTAAIASFLYISSTTVRNHVQHILRKLGVHRRLEAILTLTGKL